MAIDIDETKLARNEAGLWIGWTLATAAGMLAGYLPFLLVVDSVDLLIVRILLPIWAGFLVGLFQWFVLRQYLTHSADWIFSEGAAWSVAYALGLLIVQLLDENILTLAIAYLIFGAIIGIIQWPVFRREMPNILPWVLANVVGWALGAFLSQLVLNAIVTGDEVSQLLSSIVISGVTGLIAGAITGLALIWIVRKPEAQPYSTAPSSTREGTGRS